MKTKQIIAIGGGGFGRNPGEGIIERYILEQTKKKIPKICFIPTATGDNESYKVSFYETFTKLKCQPSHLDFFKRTPDLRKLILNQDVIFVGGGNTKSMLAVWREWKLDKILREAYESGIVMSGVSAGAICWFEKGITDSWSKDLKVMECLGFVEGNCCPHYDEEPERKPFVKRLLDEKKLINVISIEGGSALHMKNGKIFKSLSFYKNKESYIVEKKGNKLIEKKIKRSSL